MKKFNGADWARLRTDLEKEFSRGLIKIKNGRLTAGQPNAFPTTESRRKHKLISLKIKVHQGISDIGARVYSLMWSKKKNLDLDDRIKDITARVRRYEAEIQSLEKSFKSLDRKKMGKAI